MDSKQLWAIIGISLTVALAVTFISNILSQDPLLSPITPSDNSYIKANSCDADGLCEVYALATNESAGVTTNVVKSQGDMNIVANNGWLRINTGIGKGVVMNAGGELITNQIRPTSPDEPIRIGTGVVGTTEISGKFHIKDLQGHSTAYACIDSKGEIFRSNNPCR